MLCEGGVTVPVSTDGEEIYIHDPASAFDLIEAEPTVPLRCSPPPPLPPPLRGEKSTTAAALKKEGACGGGERRLAAAAVTAPAPSIGLVVKRSL